MSAVRGALMKSHEELNTKKMEVPDQGKAERNNKRRSNGPR